MKCFGSKTTKPCVLPATISDVAAQGKFMFLSGGAKSNVFDAKAECRSWALSGAQSLLSKLTVNYQRVPGQ